jgi:hypothetical protein
MNKQDYASYERAVADFMEREGIDNLSGGHIRCPECGGDWDEETCPDCGADRECCDEPFFSWRRCDCCGTSLGGNREHATGYNPTTKEIQEYTVCEDCIYYAAYGQLDDQTMLEVLA